MSTLEKACLYVILAVSVVATREGNPFKFQVRIRPFIVEHRFLSLAADFPKPNVRISQVNVELFILLKIMYGPKYIYITNYRSF